MKILWKKKITNIVIVNLLYIRRDVIHWYTHTHRAYTWEGAMVDWIRQSYNNIPKTAKNIHFNSFTCVWQYVDNISFSNLFLINTFFHSIRISTNLMDSWVNHKVHWLANRNIFLLFTSSVRLSDRFFLADFKLKYQTLNVSLYIKFTKSRLMIFNYLHNMNKNFLHFCLPKNEKIVFHRKMVHMRFKPFTILFSIFHR